MIDLSMQYLGMKLKGPIAVSSTPLSESLDNIRRMEDAGAAARDVVQPFRTKPNARQTATRPEQDARSLVERQHIARKPAPRDEEQGRGNAQQHHVGEKEQGTDHRALRVSAGTRLSP